MLILIVVSYLAIGFASCFILGRTRPNDTPEIHNQLLWRVLTAWPQFVPAFVFALGQRSRSAQTVDVYRANNGQRLFGDLF